MDIAGSDGRQPAAPRGVPVPHWRGATPPALHVMAGRHCRLEPLDPGSHAMELFAANAADREGRMWTYLAYGPFATPDEYRVWMEGKCGQADPQFYAIIPSALGTPAGVASYMRIDAPAGSIEIGGLAYSPGLQATPASTEAAHLLMKHAFDLGFRRVEWKCNSLNIPSRRAAQRFGMSFEGIHRQSAVIKGHNRDTAWYSALDREWPAVDAAFAQWLAPDNFTEDGSQRTSLSDLTHALVSCSDEFAPRRS